MVRQIQRELCNLQCTPFEFSIVFKQFGVTFGKLRLQRQNLRLDPIRQGGIGDFQDGFGTGIYRSDYTIQVAVKPLKTQGLQLFLSS